MLMNNRPAILGGSPTFSSKVPIVRPVLPTFGDLAGDVKELFESGMVTKGRHLSSFEAAVAEHLDVKHAIAVSSCTTGLMLTYRCLGLTGDVVVPSFTFMATASALVWAGLKPVFADVDFNTTNLDPAQAEAAITSNTSAIVAVHNFGNPAELDVLWEVCERRGVKLVCDAAHGFGTLYRGKPVGSQGHAHVFSLSPTKLLIAGEGGIVATNDDELAARIRIGREYGNSGRYDSAFPGINARMAEFNAIMGLHSLGNLESAAVRRNEIASLYRRMLGGIPGIGFQDAREGNRNSYKDFSITVDEKLFGLTRDKLAEALALENVDTRTYYDPPVHRQTAYAQFASAYDRLHNTELLAARSLSLPMWSCMTDEVATRICEAVSRINDFAPQVTKSVEGDRIGSAV